MISLLPLSTGHPPILHVSVQKLHKLASAFSSHSVDWANPCLLVFCWQGWFCDRISSKHLASWTLELDFKNVFSPLPLAGCPGFLCSPGGQIVFFIFNLVNACPRCRDSQRRTLSSLERCRPRESILLLLDPDPWSGLYSNPDRVSFDCRVISDHYAPCFHICLLCFLWPCLFCQEPYASSDLIYRVYFVRVITVAEPYASYLLQIFSYFSLPDFIEQFLDNYPYING